MPRTLTGMLHRGMQSIVLRNIQPAQKFDVEAVLREHGVKLIDEVDAITRKSIACPAFPLCGLAMTEAERVQPQINARLLAKLREMGMANDDFVTRTTGCPNGCARRGIDPIAKRAPTCGPSPLIPRPLTPSASRLCRPYMAEIAFVGSGPNVYQLWLGGSPNQVRGRALPRRCLVPLRASISFLPRCSRLRSPTPCSG